MSPSASGMSKPISPEMAGHEKSPIGALPPELLSRIFSYLNVPPLIDVTSVASCRLKLKEIMDHPYYRKHVTHLVWDASFYEHDLVYNSAEYHRRMMEHDGGSFSQELDDACEQDRAAISALGSYDPRPQPEPSTGNLADLPEDIPEENYSEDPGDLDDSEDDDTSSTLRLYHGYTDWRALSIYGESYEAVCNRMFGPVVPPSFMNGPFPGLDWGPGNQSPFTKFLAKLFRIQPNLKAFWIGRSNFDIPGLCHEDRRLLAKRGQSCKGMQSSWLAPENYSSSQAHEHWKVLKGVQSLRLPIRIEIGRHWHRREMRLKALHFVVTLEHTLSTLVHLELDMQRHPDPRIEPEELEDHSQGFLFKIVKHLKFDKLRSLALKGWKLESEKLGIWLVAHAKSLRHLHLIDCDFVDNYPSAVDMITKSWIPHLALDSVEIINVRFAPLPRRDAQLEPIHTCERRPREEEDPMDRRDDERARDLTRPRSKTFDQYNNMDLDEEAFNRRYHPLDDTDVGCSDVPSHLNPEKWWSLGYRHQIRKCPGERPDLERLMLNGRGNTVSRMARVFPHKYTKLPWNYWHVESVYPK
ncbi:hypothetical protein Q7P37_002381 [Cladosporium fusiforme]